MGIAKLITTLPSVDAQIGFNRGSNFGFGDNGLIKLLINLQRELKAVYPDFANSLPEGTRVQEDFTPEMRQLHTLKPRVLPDTPR
jgi:hypothetical protein